MTVDLISALGRDAVTTVLMVAAPLLGAGLALGLVIGVFQAITSVQEQTMSLVPKMLAVMTVTLVLLAPALPLLASAIQRTGAPRAPVAVIPVYQEPAAAPAIARPAGIARLTW